ncbi:MAG: hypothetical protein WC785_08795 [Tatlockia sp.]|jgi:hypothetical protein
MNKSALAWALIMLCPMAQAGHKNTLDKVEYRVSAKQWVTTQTVLLTVNINATLTNADLVRVREDIMANLGKIAPGAWQLTQFDRSQDNSGLDKLRVVAEARIPQNGLKDIYQNAQKVSKPGVTYQINGVEFKPSLQEIEQVKAQLRESLYQQINSELLRLNKIYADQKYSVHGITVYEGEQELPMAKASQPREMNTLLVASAPTLSVSNELTLSAIASLASNRQEISAVVPVK